MKKQVSQKLVLSKKTVVNLDDQELLRAKGGLVSRRETECCTLIPKTCDCY